MTANGGRTGVLGIEGATLYLHPALGECLIAADAVVPAIVALVLLAVILRGSNETCERVFRLLRWAVNRPEPPGQATPAADHASRECRHGTTASTTGGVNSRTASSPESGQAPQAHRAGQPSPHHGQGDAVDPGSGP